MTRSFRLVVAAWLIFLPLFAALAPLAKPIWAAGADERCGEDEEGDYRTRMPNTGGAKFLWRGAEKKLQASVTLLQDKCSCTDHETIVDPLTGEEREGGCIERKWKEQAGFDRSKSPVWDSDLAFEKPRLMQLGANSNWEKICAAPWHNTRGVVLPEAEGLEYDFRGSNQEEYHVWGYIFVRGGIKHQDGRSHCEQDTLSDVATNVHDKAMGQLALRHEERFDIDAAVQAAVAGLPYDQIRVGVNPAYDPANPNATGLVGLGSYFWLEGADGPPFSGFLVPVPGWGGRRLSAWVVAYPTAITWAFGDGTTLTTTSRGLPWPQAEVAEGVPRQGAIVKVYQVDGAYPITVQVTWAARWGLHEENNTLCSVAPPTYCSPFIPIYAAGPATSVQVQAYRVRQAQAIGVYVTPAPQP